MSNIANEDSHSDGRWPVIPNSFVWKYSNLVMIDPKYLTFYYVLAKI